MISYEPLLDFIKKKDVSLTKLSVEIGLPSASLTNSIYKGRCLYVSTVVSICNYLKCSIEDIICYKASDSKETKQLYQLNWDKIQGLGSLRSVSLSAGKGQSWLFDMKRNKTCISNYDLQKIADIYSCDMKDLIIQSEVKND